jgi:hypothetical protein
MNLIPFFYIICLCILIVEIYKVYILYRPKSNHDCLVDHIIDYYEKKHHYRGIPVVGDVLINGKGYRWVTNVKLVHTKRDKLKVTYLENSVEHTIIVDSALVNLYNI